MTSIAVSAEDVTYAIRGKKLIAGVSLALERGQMTAVIGPNGAGKSSLLRILAGELAPSSGRVCYANVDAQLLAPWQLAARRVVMAQTTRLAFPFSVWEVAALGIDGLGRRFRLQTNILRCRWPCRRWRLACNQFVEEGMRGSRIRLRIDQGERSDPAVGNLE